MKSSHRSRFFALLALAFLLFTSRAGAQITNLSLILNVSPTNGVTVGDSITYSMLVSNISGVQIQAYVTNSFSGPVSIVSATNTLGGTVYGTNSVSSNRVVFAVIAQSGLFPLLSVTVTATNSGFITNMITLFEGDLGEVVGTAFIVHPVTNFTINSDLAVSIFGPAAPVYSNDWTSFRVAVTNSGASVTNVTLTTLLPPDVGVLSISPTNAGTTNHTVAFNLGTLTNGASRTFTLQIQPTNSGSLSITSIVSAPNLVDSNPTNNTAATNLTVLDFVPASLVASNVTAMTFNPQTGLMNQTVRLFNTGPNQIQSARLVVTGVTNLVAGSTNWLFNAVGTNNGNPFVIYGNTLNAGASVDLVLEYFIRARTAIPVQNSNYVALATAAADFTSASGTNGTFAITLFTNLPDGSRLIEFGITLTGRTYTVLYRDSLSSTTLQAQPSVVAQGNRVQWIDDGPPKTISHPTNAPSRFYSVRLEP